jgi:hypothetical protein
MITKIPKAKWNHFPSRIIHIEMINCINFINNLKKARRYSRTFLNL